MPHGLDHIVHAVRDLDAAAEFYGSAGFTVGTRNRHPFGTHNRIVQLRNCYIEIVEIAEPEKIAPHASRSFSFGAFNRDFLANREGFSMLLQNSRDAGLDARSFEAGGIGGFDVFDFAREGRGPDGAIVKLAFSLAYAADPASPDVRFAACQHHFPENFWNPAFQFHANGSRSVKGVILVASNPASHQNFLKAFTGIGELQSAAASVIARTENGDIEILQPTEYSDRVGTPSGPIGTGMTLKAMRFAVDDISQTEALLRRNGLAGFRHDGRLVFAPDAAHGATLIFEKA
jgi:glyoxalase-like protein